MGRIERNRQMRQNRDVLERILMLLLSLAGLADRASVLPARDRLHVLGILACGEAEARSLIIAMAHGSAAPAHVDAAELASPDAGRLAASLRGLALLLSAMLVEARRLAPSLHPAACPLGQPGQEPMPSPAAPATSSASPAPDTS